MLALTILKSTSNKIMQTPMAADSKCQLYSRWGLNIGFASNVIIYEHTCMNSYIHCMQLCIPLYGYLQCLYSNTADGFGTTITKKRRIVRKNEQYYMRINNHYWRKIHERVCAISAQCYYSITIYMFRLNPVLIKLNTRIEHHMN